MYIVREGERRGRGSYLTKADYLGFDLWFYTKKQRRARRFASLDEAKSAAASVEHVTVYRVVKFREKEG